MSFPRSCRRGASFVALAAIAACSPASNDAVEYSDPPIYKDATAAIDARIDDLMVRMTTEEKIAQIVTIWNDKTQMFDDENNLDLEKTRKKIPLGLGQFARPSDAIGPASPREIQHRDVRQTIELVNALQQYVTTETRLGIPILFHEEGLHGYQSVGSTSFPQAIALASSWDPKLIRDVNSVTAREIRARGAHLVLSPVVDVARDPRWGRIEETFGEDPYLVGEMGVAAVQGLQGDSNNGYLADNKVFATLKHMTGHGQPESGTNIGPAQISERELRENFFPPFEQVVRRTGIKAVMASYNEIDGVPSHANRWLLHDVLRGEWQYDGAVVSDYYAIEQMAEIHHIAADAAGAAVRALQAGVDVDLPSGVAYSTLGDALAKGLIDEQMIDTAVRRHLEIKFRAGLFEQPFADVESAEAITNNDDAVAMARLAAQRSIVLLTNKGVLPLALPEAPARKPTIAVIGPNAAVARLGGYYGTPPVTISPLEGIRARVGDRANVVYAQGVVITEDDDWWADEVVLGDPVENHRRIAEAMDLARSADTIILAIGDTEQTSREAWADGHLGDRSSLDLVGEQQALFDALKALGKPIVVLLVNGRPASTVAIAEQADALVEAWYLGEQGGNAIADILFGDVNPGGKLPVTIPRSVGQLPMVYNYKPSAHRGYLFGTTEPLFPFGWGLSYTKFELGAPVLSAQTINTDGAVDVTVKVTNTGKRAGDETVQLYIRDKISSVTRPVKELKAFERVSLAPGESRNVTFKLGTESFQMWNDKMQRVIEPGEFDIMTGPNSVELQNVTLTIKGST
jgi:beta-glucosidase